MSKSEMKRLAHQEPKYWTWEELVIGNEGKGEFPNIVASFAETCAVANDPYIKWQAARIKELESDVGALTRNNTDLLNQRFELLDAIPSLKTKVCKYQETISKLREALGNLIHHFQDYGLEEESFALLMEVEKAQTVIHELFGDKK